MSKRGQRALALLLPVLLILVLGIGVTGYAQDGTPQRGGTPSPDFQGERFRDSGTLVQETGRPVVESVLPTGQVLVNVELVGEPAALVFARFGGEDGGMGAFASAEAQANSLVSAQAQFTSSLATTGISAQVVAQTQYVVNMVTLAVDISQLDALRARPDVKNVFMVRQFERETASSMVNIGAPSAWDGSLGGEYLGQGIVIAVIDDGIDYTHAHFGGNGNFSQSDTIAEREVIGDDPNFPGPKVIGGYDFVGDAYDASTPGLDTPDPDPDPQSCPITEGYTGHGTHVAGIAAGYGVKADGSTFGNPSESYDNLPANMIIGPGAAPLASLLAMKVFGCNGSVDDYVVVQAIDAAVSGQYGGPADVINMSLGSSFGGGHDDPNRSIYVAAVNNAIVSGVTVVASAGNNYDTWFTHGSPGSTPGIISVASTADGGEDGILIDGTPYPARKGIENPPLTILGPAPFIYLPGNGCSASQYASFPANHFAVIDWTGACGSVNLMTAAQDAPLAGGNAPLGILVANNVPFAFQNLTCGYRGAESNPPYVACVSISQETGDYLAANPSAMITMDPNLAVVATANVDTISTFSSRGPASFAADGFGPDIAAPGDSITSAGAGTGFEPYNLGGTSMASPTVAGVVALVYSNPEYAHLTPYQMKALLMNTANADVYLGNNVSGPRVAPQRMGAGRVSVEDAMLSEVIAFNRLRPDHVAVNFLYPEVTYGDTATLTKQVRVQNLGTQTATYSLSFDVYTDANLAQFSVSPSSVTVGPRAYVDVTVTLTINTNVVNTQNFSDPASSTTQATSIGTFSRHFLSEEGAILVLTPVSGASVPLRVPVYAAPRATSEMYSLQPGLADDGAVGTGITLVEGAPLADPGPTLREAPVSLASVFQLVGTDAVGDTIVSAPNSDIEYVGVASNYWWGGSDSDGSWNDSGVVWVALATANDWNTPNNTIFDIYLDTNMDGDFTDAVDVNVYNYNPLVAGTTSSRSDVHLSVGGALGDCCYYHEFLNGFNASLNTYLNNTNVMILPFYPTLGDTLTTTKFNLYVDVFDREAGGYVDTTPVFTVDLENPVIDTWAQSFIDAYALDTPGAPLFFDYNLFDYDLSRGIPTALVLHHHNDNNATNPYTGENFRRAELVYLNVQTVDLDVEKYTVGRVKNFAPGSTVTYVLEAYAFSEGDAFEFELVDELPAMLSFVSASPECSHTGEANGGTVTCFDSITSGETKLYEVTVTIDAGFIGKIKNTVVGIPDALEESPGNNEDTFRITVGSTTATTITEPLGDVANNTPTFTWEAVEGSDMYYLYISSNGNSVFNQWYDAAAVCSGESCSVEPGLEHSAGNYEAVVQTWHPETGFGDYSTVAYYTVTTPPNAPTTITANGAINETNPLFTFSRVDAGWYNIWVSQNTVNGGVLAHQGVYIADDVCNDTECAIDAGLNLSAGNYTWWVRGWNQWGAYGEWSAPTHFQVATSPNVPSAIAPINATDNGTPTFQWTEVPSATWYDVWIRQSDTTVFNQLYDQSTICSNGMCSVTPGLNLGGGSYSWWVRAWSPLGGYGEWSAETVFSVVTPPATPVMVSPSGAISETNPLLTFERDPSATWFFIWLTNGANPVHVQWYDGGLVCADTTCSINANLNLASGQYSWWVQGWNPNGGYSSWSGPMVFEVNGSGEVGEVEPAPLPAPEIDLNTAPPRGVVVPPPPETTPDPNPPQPEATDEASGG